MLPLGDGKISQGPNAGCIWACHTDPNGGGAFRDGPWIDKKSGTFDFTAKTAVRGSVRWPHKFSVTRVGDKRVLTSNDYPNHPTGIFRLRATILRTSSTAIPIASRARTSA